MLCFFHNVPKYILLMKVFMESCGIVMCANWTCNNFRYGNIKRSACAMLPLSRHCI